MLTGKQVLVLPGENGIYSPDGKHLLYVPAHDRKTIIVCDALTGIETGEFRGHLDWIEDVIISPDSQRVISLDMGPTIAVWNMRTKQQVLSIPAENNYIGGRLVIGPHGRTLAHIGVSVKFWSTGRISNP